MIQSGRASLVVSSVATNPDEVSDVLGLEPSKVALRGSRMRSGRVVERHTWWLDVDELKNTGEDETGTRALRELLDICRPAMGRITQLPGDCEVNIWWSALSDSAQGGFVLPADLAGQIAAVGVDVYATVYFDEAVTADAD